MDFFQFIIDTELEAILNEFCFSFDNLDYLFNNKNIECPILLKEYYEGVKLPCNHEFSREGIKEWIRQGKFTCPLCRFCIIHKINH